MLLWHLTPLLGLPLSFLYGKFLNLYQQMFVYNFVFLSHHDFYFITFRTQFPVVQKFNQNVVTRRLPFNLKQTYQTSSIRPCSLLLSRACPKQNILQNIIITLLYRSKNVLNLIILVSMHLLPL